MAAQEAFGLCGIVLAQGADDLPVLLHGLQRLRMGLHAQSEHPRAMRLVPAVGDDLAQAAVASEVDDLKVKALVFQRPGGDVAGVQMRSKPSMTGWRHI